MQVYLNQYTKSKAELRVMTPVASSSITSGSALRVWSTHLVYSQINIGTYLEQQKSTH
jgi:hypothetical protein